MEPTELNADRPERVAVAIILLYLTLGIGMLRSFYETARLDKSAPIGLIVLITVLSLTITAIIIYMIGKGKNWARITYLVLFLIGIPFAIMPLLQSLTANLFSGILGIGQTVMQTIALIYLFQRTSSEWFKRAKRPEMISS